ncbi:MAG TPA: glutamate--tRNA ligase [Syntrophales bacterium]|nr:glutamate--tRNA ligase [Syntrophales bacterium]
MSVSLRLRFAPSPTGELHVGNARTAALNWLFARHHGGTFVLRIEDTDRERSTDAFAAGICDDLRWLGIDWDEGPDRGGDCGPYRQSERFDLYERYLAKLRDGGHVYPCYCTEEELEAERSVQLARRVAPRYSGRCRNLTPDQRESEEKRGRKPAWRFRSEHAAISFDDLIRGPVRFEGADIGDFIIVRSSGLPAYNFAVVVDDHLMRISHVIRGEDHLSNTAPQLMLYRALGFEPPVFAHHSLVLGADRAKLSKRHGAVSVRAFREEGVLPEALLNYLALLGASAADGQEIGTSTELIASFSLDRLGKGGAVFDEAKLKWLNAAHLKLLAGDRLAERLLPFSGEAGRRMAGENPGRFRQIAEACRDNLRTLADIAPFMEIFDPLHFSPGPEALRRASQEGDVLAAFGEALRRVQPGDGYFRRAVRHAEERTGRKGKRLLLPLRLALTGRSDGPELEKVVALLGGEETMERIERVLNFERGAEA